MSSFLSVLEFICNMRWLLSYLFHRLDPVVEAHYKHIIEHAKLAESAVSHSYVMTKSLADVPSGLLMLAREGVVYLLVAEGILGHCPPTMHSFLLRATTTADIALTSEYASSSNNSFVSQFHCSAGTEYQSQFLCVRWLLAEGILSDEELLDVLGDDKMDVSATGRESSFELHVNIAKFLSSEGGFALQTHVAIMRALLLHYCCTLLSANDIMSHVRFIDPTCYENLESMEDSLLFWMQQLLRIMHKKGIIDDILHNAGVSELSCSLYESVNNGVVLGLVMHYYKPNLFPLSDIIDACDFAKKTQQAQDYCSHNWGLVLRVSEELGLLPCLYADEVGQYGTVVLQLHVLRLLEELFALLATQAEDFGERSAENPDATFGHEVVSPSLQGVCDQDSLDHVLDEKAERIAKLERQGIVNSARKGETDMVRSNDDGGKDVTAGQKESEASVGFSSRSSYPSAYSRRQYDVMKATLQLRVATAAAFEPFSTSPKADRVGTTATTTSTGRQTTATGSSLLKPTRHLAMVEMSRKPVSDARSEAQNRVLRRISTDVVDSFTTSTSDDGGNCCTNQTSDVEDGRTYHVSDGVAMSFLQPSKLFSDDEALSTATYANCHTHFFPEYVVAAKDTQMALRTTSSASSFELNNECFFTSEPTAAVFSASSQRVRLSFVEEGNTGTFSTGGSVLMLGTSSVVMAGSVDTQTEASFHVTSAQARDVMPAGGGQETVVLFTTTSERTSSMLLGQEGTYSQGISPITPDLATEKSGVCFPCNF